ncbi:Myc-type, basic helix-loop-helix [Sesbania bispinosa]|nr:Myc-type, basic helix-loop-helix [Sesbania bispinosa]
MDNMFQFDQTDDCSNFFPLPSSPNTNNPNLLLIEADTNLCSHKLSSSDSKPNENKKRKIMHRDIERQRRQEMATLHASLRSLLPVEYLKGKRSISDHMHQAVNYIKHLGNKIEELNNKRDRLRKLCNTGKMENSQAAKQDVVVTVRSCWIGIEVVINTAHEEGFPLSRVLQALIREGFRVINCSSTKVKGRLFHTIESEENNDGRRIDQSELQQKLTSLISQS